MAVPEFSERYLSIPPHTLVHAAGSDPINDLTVQLHKLSTALLTDQYIEAPSSSSSSVPSYPNLAYNLTPIMFKSVIGRDSREFSSSKQQDASEFFQYFLDHLTTEEVQRNALNRFSLVNPHNKKPSARLFEWQMEERLQCLATKRVKYTSNESTVLNTLELRIPAGESASSSSSTQISEDKQEVDERAKKQKKAAAEDVIPLEACLSTYFAPSAVDMRLGSHSSASTQTMEQTVRFKTFPRYLMVKLGRYYVDSSWRQRKIEAPVDVPELLDLSAYRSIGRQEGELALTTEDKEEERGRGAKVEEVAVDEGVVAQLVSMGFGERGARKAAAVGGSDVEAAMNFLLANMDNGDDENVNDDVHTLPYSAHTAPAKSSAEEEEEEGVNMLMSLGYSAIQAQTALQRSSNNVESAADWLLTTPPDLMNAAVQVPLKTNIVLLLSSYHSFIYLRGKEFNERKTSDMDVSRMKEEEEEDLNGSSSGKYALLGVITHLGKNTDHGNCGLLILYSMYSIIDTLSTCQDTTSAI